MREREKSVDIQRLFRLRGERLHLFAEISDLPRRHEPQMAALEHAFVEPRQKAEAPDAEALLDGGGERSVRHGGTLVEYNAADAALGPEAQKPFDDREHGERRAARVHHEHDRRFRNEGELIRARFPCGEPRAVIKAHCPLDNAHIAPRGVFREQEAERVFRKKMQIEIGALRADDAAVEHRVDVVRPAFERAGLQAAVQQRLQYGAHDRRLAAAAAHAGDHDSVHKILPMQDRRGRFSAGMMYSP